MRLSCVDAGKSVHTGRRKLREEKKNADITIRAMNAGNQQKSNGIRTERGSGMGDMPAVKERKSNKKRKTRRGLKVFGVLFLLFSLAIFAVGLWFYARYGRTILSYYHKAKSIMREASAEDFKKSRTSIIYATDGTVIKALQSEKDVYYLPYADIPEAVVTAMIPSARDRASSRV